MGFLKMRATEEEIRQLLLDHNIPIALENIASMDQKTFMSIRLTHGNGLDQLQKKIISEIRKKGK